MWYKYKFWCYMHAFFLREKAGALIIMSLTVPWWWLLSKQSSKAGRAMILRTLRKFTSRENCDQIVDWCLQGEGGYLCQNCNSRAETNKEANPIRAQTINPWYQSCRRIPLCSMVHACCKERKGVKLNFTQSAPTDARHIDQAEDSSLLVHPHSRALS